ncbi:unnamed protein product [Rhizoctonia solani]|uniref:F-box domain-containing protein n=1 Tax=Rhizoctonia solani TaxID=456999 RepID=A0A8H3GMV8_9AGAM|nr:unnamed protein product [Rhizoctonia solani]
MAFARHSVLQSTDILPAIFAHLDQADLARALRVCHLWSQWSDVLWSSLPTLTPMLHLLFPFMFTDTDDKYVRGVPLYQMDRQKLSKVNRTIRHLDASLSSSKSLFEGYNPDIPRLLLDLCETDSSLFPRLLSLRTECRNDAEVLGILPLLTPSLRSLTIVIHHSATDYMHELMDGINSNLQNLEYISISYQPAPATTSSEVTDGQPAARELDSYFYFPMIAPALPRSLRILCLPSGCASIDALFNISRLPLLESLTFTGKWEVDMHEEEWPELEAGSFPTLNQLVVSDCSIRAAIGLLSVIPESTPLGEVEITLSEINSELRELWSTFARFQRSIRGVSVNYVGPDSSSIRAQEIPEALAVCSKLEKLTLNAPVEMSDEEFGALVNCLPHTCAVRIGERHT